MRVEVNHGELAPLSDCAREGGLAGARDADYGNALHIPAIMPRVVRPAPLEVRARAVRGGREVVVVHPDALDSAHPEEREAVVALQTGRNTRGAWGLYRRVENREP